MSVAGLRCRCLSENKDLSGRPLCIPGSDFWQPFQSLLVAGEEIADLSFQRELQIQETLETNLPGVFAAGDVTGGSKNILAAISQGTKVAYRIHNYLLKRRSNQNPLLHC